MSLDYEFRPIVQWPGKLTAKRKRAPFRATYANTLDLLEHELRQLSASAIVLQVALQIGDIRLDGRPRAGSRPTHPGVILSFDSRHGPLSYPCDTFDDFEDNIRAIALSLEHLRAVDRYGVTKRGEQYTGWSQLPPPIVTAPPMTHGRAMSILTEAAGVQALGKTWQEAYRLAVLATHPDRSGDAARFKLVQAAKEFLEGQL